MQVIPTPEPRERGEPRMTIINSRQNPRVKDAVRLRDAQHRQQQRRILIDGATGIGPRDRRRRAHGRGLRLRRTFPRPRCPAVAGLACPAAAAKSSRSAGRSSRSSPSAIGPRACWAWPKCRRGRSTASRCRKIPWSPCWRASRSRATSAPSCAAPTAPALVGRHRGRRRHRPLQPQCHPRQPGHDLYRAGVRGRRGGDAGLAARAGIEDLRRAAGRLDWPTPRPTIAARRRWCWAARRPGFPRSGRPPT